jgi:glycosyltransferase involved in cell wall biosynthesis
VRSSRVSVVIPLYNRASLVDQTLRCLAPDLHEGVQLEIIVVDDGSTDGGVEVVRRTAPQAIVLGVPHGGAARARNSGLGHATGEFILLMDSDDLVEPDFFRERVHALHENPSADAAYGPWEHFFGAGDFEPGDITPRFMSYPIERQQQTRSHLVRLLRGWYIAPHTLLWRAAALRRVGGHSEALRVNQDVDLLFRVLVSGSGIVGVDAPRALYRDHEGPRQGSLATKAKAWDLLHLRETFVATLTRNGMLDEEASVELGAFCFEQWRTLRKTLPDVAASFLELSRKLSPGMALAGRWPLRMLAKVVGPAAAIKLRDAF